MGAEVGAGQAEGQEMSDENTTEDSGSGDDVGQDGDTGDGSGGEVLPEITKLRQEAASHRRKAREAEVERDRLVGLVSSMQRNEVERRAEQTMHRGEDLWAAGVELGELLDDGGALDLTKVDARVAEVIEARPHWRRPHVQGDADQGHRTTSQPSLSWAEALRPGRP